MTNGLNGNSKQQPTFSGDLSQCGKESLSATVYTKNRWKHGSSWCWRGRDNGNAQNHPPLVAKPSPQEEGWAHVGKQHWVQGGWRECVCRGCRTYWVQTLAVTPRVRGSGDGTVFLPTASPSPWTVSSGPSHFLPYTASRLLLNVSEKLFV